MRRDETTRGGRFVWPEAHGVAWLGTLAGSLLLLLVGCASSSSDVPSESSTAYKLYVVDTKRPPAGEEAAELRPYRRELLLLAERCTNPEIRLGDFAVHVQTALAERFVEATTVEILQVTNAGLAGEQGHRDCTRAFALAQIALEGAG